MKPRKPISRLRTHQLASSAGLSFTPAAMRELILHSKAVGFAGDFVTVPAAWHESLTPQVAVEIAMEHDVTIDVCGFLNGAAFNPLSKAGRAKAEDELQRQLGIHKVLAKAGVAGKHINGPIDQGWMNPERSQKRFDQDAYESWVSRLGEIAVDEDIQMFIEPLNEVESAVPEAFRNLYLTMAATGNDGYRLKFQWDTGHAWKRKVGVDFFEQLLEEGLIGMFEFANIGRVPLDCRRGGIPFLQYIDLFPNLPEGCLVATEPFDYEGVIKPLGLEKLCDTKLSGFDALRRDAEYLISRGVMIDPNASA